MVLIGAMQKGGVEEQSIPWDHFYANELQAFRNLRDTLHIRASLLSGHNVINTPEQVRAAQDLHAFIPPPGWVNRHEGATQQRKLDPVLVAVTVILVRRPPSIVNFRYHGWEDR